MLADDLLASLRSAPDGAPRQVLLWLDPEQQFARLVEHLEPPLLARQAQLLRHDPQAGTGQLVLKVALLRVEADPASSAVVYLAGFDGRALEPRADGGVPTLWSVYEYRYKGAVWGLGSTQQVGAVPEPPTLLDWLQSHGVQAATEKARRELSKGGADALIGRYAERQRTIAPAEWPRPLRLSDVEALLGGDPRDALRRLLAAPTNEVKGWGQERPTVLSGVASVFGLKAPKHAEDPETLADAFALDLALAEAWDAFGRPGTAAAAGRRRSGSDPFGGRGPGARGMVLCSAADSCPNLSSSRSGASWWGCSRRTAGSSGRAGGAKPA